MPREKGKRFLVVRYDVTGWSEHEINNLAGEAIVQGEANKEDPERYHRDAASVTASVEDDAGYKVRDV